MGAQDDSGASFSRNVANERQYLPLAGRVETQCRLVEEDHARAIHQRPRYAQPLPHPAAVRRDRRRAAVSEPHLHKQHFSDLTRPPCRVAEQPRVVPQELGARLVQRIAGALRQHADSRTNSRSASCAELRPPRTSRSSAGRSSRAPGSPSSCPLHSGPEGRSPLPRSPRRKAHEPQPSSRRPWRCHRPSTMVRSLSPQSGASTASRTLIAPQDK